MQAAGVAEPTSLRPALKLLASLYGMTRIEKEAAFYLAAGAMDGKD